MFLGITFPFTDHGELRKACLAEAEANRIGIRNIRNHEDLIYQVEDLILDATAELIEARVIDNPDWWVFNEHLDSLCEILDYLKEHYADV